MINIMSQSGKTTAYLKELVIDSIEDIAKLPTDIAPGSNAYCIENGNVYILNGDRKWVLML